MVSVGCQWVRGVCIAGKPGSYKDLRGVYIVGKPMLHRVSMR